MKTKEKILGILNADSFVSGEELAQKCEVSRAAIWKAINSLREDGYEIEAVTNKGYKIASMPDKLSSEKISELIKKLGTEPGKIFCFETIDSTNSEAKRKAILAGSFRNQNGDLNPSAEEFHRSLFASSHQTSGRGRLGRVFASPENSGIYFSLLYSPKNGVENPALFTAAAAVAVSKAVDELYGTDCKIKWVNDVFSSSKKICGILTEGISNFETGKIEAAIVGIGINIRNAGFSGDLAKVAGNIEDSLIEMGKSVPNVSKNELLANIIHNLLDFYDAYERKDKIISDRMMQEYRERSMLIGKTVQIHPAAGIQGETYMAKVLDISESAELVVETENGEKKCLYSGEVSLHSFDFI